jgi:purine nucleoside phosphorylase
MRASDLLNLFFVRIGGTIGTGRIGGSGTLDPALNRAIDEAARLEGIELRTGALCGSLGPSYETASEIRLWRRIGASAACMSTLPEAFAARAAGMRVAAVSLITNLGTGIASGPLDHAEVMALGARAGSDLGRLLRRMAEIL